MSIGIAKNRSQNLESRAGTDWPNTDRSHPSMKQTTVFLADPLHVVRKGICLALQRQRGIRVVGEADNGRDAANACRKLKPDVLITDINMPRLNGLETAHQVNECSRQTRVLLFSAINEPFHIYHLERSVYLGIPGFLDKNAPLEELCKAVVALAAGKNYYSPVIRAELAFHKKTPGWGKKDTHGHLTPRQREVAQLITESFLMKKMADELQISTRTVERHKADIETKLGVKGDAAIALWCYRTGMSNGG